ncbi:MAG: DUF1778 domain-containing protein [Bryobacterales bacterium]|nr:DUF1778 domain-containing protein [Bryobacterales bacterium]
MGIMNPRRRVITFRLSISEYERVSCAAKGSGARSLSDFARGAVLERAQIASNVSNHEQLRVLSEMSQQLFQTLLEVNERLKALPAWSADANPVKEGAF